MKRVNGKQQNSVDFLIIGAGPAGLGAAIEFAARGGSVLIADENEQPGGQLAKQIHKFFGSSSHFAGTRGFSIGEKLITEALDSGVEIATGSRVLGLLRDGTVPLSDGQRMTGIRAKRILIAAGGKENALAFPGWTLPGVMTAGAAQTFCNIHRILPAERPVMVGSGNVGLIVSYQLLQAGAGMQGIVEIQDFIGGYEVHAAKIRRARVPFFMKTRISRAFGSTSVEAVELENISTGEHTKIETDGVFLSVGLTPRTELPSLFGCRLLYEPALGGFLPCHDSNMRTSVPRVFIAGDAAGIEEANTALDEGRLAGVAAAEDCGYIEAAEARTLKTEIQQRLTGLRSGIHSLWRLEAKARITGTATPHVPGLSAGAAAAAVCGDVETVDFSSPGYSRERLQRGFVPLINCPQPIPCNPCVDVCPAGAISMGGVCDKPVLDTEKCTGCMKCISICPGLAIRTVTVNSDGTGSVALPYEYLPYPEKGDAVQLTDGSGNSIGNGTVRRVLTSKAFDKTAVVIVTVPKQLIFSVCGFITGDRDNG